MQNPHHMHFTFFSNDPTTSWIEVRWEIPTNSGSSFEIQWPAWRPGRYELQNFSQHVGRVWLENSPGTIEKISKDRWVVSDVSVGPVVIRYRYFANEINAGSSFLGADFWYLNPINCTPYIPDRRGEPVTAFFPGTSHCQYAGGLAAQKTTEGWVLHAADYDHWVDSPLLLSPTLQKQTYHVQNIPFTLWIEGHYTPNWEQLIPEFKAFTQQQLDIFGEFPEPDYHFLLWVVDFPFYHGVEHRNSTMMVLGPPQQDPEEFRRDLLGLASHELFHTWNVCKIRPKELRPYDYAKENYFTTCFIAEGITTYYGDEMLRRSGVFSAVEYKNELETLCRRHFETADPAEISLLDSSLDLWVDGYKKGVPNRKVSVYHKGALVAMLLDQLIREKSQGKASLDSVMLAMWQKFGKTEIGYSYADFQLLVEQYTGKMAADTYFKKYIEGTESLWEDWNGYLQKIGHSTLRKTTEGRISWDE